MTHRSWAIKRFLGVTLAGLVILMLTLAAGAGVALAATGDDTGTAGRVTLFVSPETEEGDAGTEDPAQAGTADTNAGPSSENNGSLPDADSGTEAAPDGAGSTTGTAGNDEGGAATSTYEPVVTEAGIDPDYNGDGRTELTILYDFGNATTGLYVFDPTDSGYSGSRQVWLSAPGTWDWKRSKMVTTDYNGDARTELTVLYDLGNDTAGLYVFEPSADGYSAPQRVWVSDPGTWDWRRSKITAGDYDGDARSEVTVLYGLGGDTAGLYVFDPTASGFGAPRQVWYSGPGGWDWRRSKLVTGDHDGDGRTEVTVLYDFYGDTAGLYLFDPTASGYAAPQRVWYSGPGTWDWKRSKLVSVDNDGDGSTELAVLYDLSGDSAGLYLFDSAVSGYAAPQRVWYSGPGTWDWKRSKVMVGDHNGDASTEVTVIYDLSNATTGLYVFEPSAGGYNAPQRVWYSGPGTWEWRQTKITGDSFTPKTTFLGMSWIDINLSRQVLTAIAVVANEIAEGYFTYQTMAIFSTLIASGGPGYETPTGRFFVYAKHVAIDMSGPGYYAPAVPFTLWFTGPYSIHGTYWHNSFGYPHSHGCVNLPTPAAQWLFERTPVGMPVLVHY